MSEYCYCSRSRFKKTFENLNGGRLPCTVRSQQTKALACADLKVESANGLHFSVISFAKIAALNRERHRHILNDTNCAFWPAGAYCAGEACVEGGGDVSPLAACHKTAFKIFVLAKSGREKSSFIDCSAPGAFLLLSV